MSTPSILFQWEYNYPYVDEVNFRLYENGNVVVDDIGELHFVLLMDGKEYGDYQYQVTAFRNGIESTPSNTVNVDFTQPAAPTNLTAKLGGLIE